MSDPAMYPPPGSTGASAMGGASAASGFGSSTDTSGLGASTGSDYVGARSGDPDIGEMSLGELVSKVTTDLSTLMRQEIELAKAEVTTEVKKASKGAGMLGGAGYAGHLMILFLSFALAFALGSVIPLGWSSLIVAGIWAIVAAVLALNGRKQMQAVRPKPERTIDTIREVPSALKG